LGRVTDAAKRLRVAVLASGRGSNLQSLIDACALPDFPAAIGLVVVNVPGAQAIDRARAADVPVTVIDHKGFASREMFDAALDEALRDTGIELICLAGFMRLLTPGFTWGWEGRIVNIHPSLLPSFPGLHTHRRALTAGVKLHGCTVHYVTAALDDGPIVAQAAVPVLSGDDEDSLAARVLAAEHTLYPKALRLIASGRVRVVDGRALVDDAADDEAGPEESG
jgi:phosphoribosylglycinamide formyltransferase-1